MHVDREQFADVSEASGNRCACRWVTLLNVSGLSKTWQPDWTYNPPGRTRHA